MPNWCSNSLVVSGKSFKTFNRWLAKGGLSLERIAPTPPELLNETAPNRKTDKEKARLVKKFGAEDWYNWRVANWGTKWDIIDEDDSNVQVNEGPGFISFGFDSAWAPPTKAITALSKKFKSLTFELTYFEPGCCFAGKAEIKAGECEDNYVEEGPLYKQIAGEFGWEDEEE